ncbi:MAG: DUF2062 domain-containing protein [Deltaproteobacteria bacterium]|nr:DUF2062 domain-containing protein [Deltaproteobacteria bacterium]
MKSAKGNGVRNNRKGNRIRRILKYLYLRFIRLRGQPHDIALGIAFGIFAGSIPIVPFQTALAVFLALIFKGSKITAALGTWISNPLTWYFFYFYSYKIGAWILGLRSTHKVSHAILTSIHDGESIWLIFRQAMAAGGGFMAAFLLGGLVLGAVFSIPSYFVSLRMIRYFQTYRTNAGKVGSCRTNNL